MKKNTLYHNFYRRWQEVTDLPPQQMGPFTPLYKSVIPFFKWAPWRIIIPLTLFAVAVTFFVLEITSVQIASILQNAF